MKISPYRRRIGTLSTKREEKKKKKKDLIKMFHLIEIARSALTKLTLASSPAIATTLNLTLDCDIVKIPVIEN